MPRSVLRVIPTVVRLLITRIIIEVPCIAQLSLATGAARNPDRYRLVAEGLPFRFGPYLPSTTRSCLSLSNLKGVFEQRPDLALL